MKRLRGTGFWRQITLFAVLGVAGAAFAARDDHLAWVQPEEFVGTPGAVLSLGYGRGELFGVRGASVTAADVESVHVDLSGSPAPAVGFARPGAEPKTLVTVTKPGYALVDVTLRPQRRNLAASEVPGYLRSLHAPDELLTLWAQQPAGAEWIETRRFSLKTALKVGQPTENDQNWARNRGRSWEIVAAQNPCNLKKNDRFRVQVLDQGSPVAGVLVDFVSTGETIQHVVTTDKNGFAEAPLGETGLWLIHAVDIKRLEAERLEWVVDFAAFTVFVGPFDRR